MSEVAVEELELVVFDVAGARYAADLTQVRRIDLDDPTESVGPLLGTPARGHRALVFALADGHERRLVVDHVHGVSRVPVSSLRRMPAAVHAAPWAVGAWLDGDSTVLLIDLVSTASVAP
ncbi:MAG: Frizzy aggregation protein FrzB [Myxococcota bacterium]